MKKYIDLNVSHRADAKNEFEKDFFKLMNNAVFGKTMENIQNRVDIELINSEEKARKLHSKVNFDKRTIFSDYLVAVHMHKTKIKLNKPIYLGMSILDISKTLMFKFHCKYIKKKFGDKAELLLTDTDSLIYLIKNYDFYKIISPDVWEKFDTSNYPKDHPSGIPTSLNKKVGGMFKDECTGKIMAEFAVPRPKVYSYITYGDDEGGGEEGDKKCEGIKKSVMKKELVFKDYKDCVLNGKETMKKMNIIRHREHKLFTENINKIALSPNDDKHIVMGNKIDTLSYGHYMENMINVYENIFGFKP